MFQIKFSSSERCDNDFFFTIFKILYFYFRLKMSDNFNYTFSKIGCHSGGSDREPVALFFQMWTPFGQKIIEDEFYHFPSCGQIESYQTDHIHGYETSPARRLHNIGKIILVVFFFIFKFFNNFWYRKWWNCDHAVSSLYCWNPRCWIHRWLPVVVLGLSEWWINRRVV